MISFFILEGTFRKRLQFVDPITLIQKYGSIFDHFVINILQNEKQYL